MPLYFSLRKIQLHAIFYNFQQQSLNGDLELDSLIDREFCFFLTGILGEFIIDVIDIFDEVFYQRSGVNGLWDGILERRGIFFVFWAWFKPICELTPSWFSIEWVIFTLNVLAEIGFN